MTRLDAVTFLVRDYDEAISWFVGVLEFRLIADRALGETKRWVLVEATDSGSRLLLAKAEGPGQEAAIGKAAAGRVAFFLYSDEFSRDHAALQARGVRFLEAPRHEAYGTVAVFEDLYGNQWDLIEPSSAP